MKMNLILRDIWESSKYLTEYLNIAVELVEEFTNPNWDCITEQIMAECIGFTDLG